MLGVFSLQPCRVVDRWMNSRAHAVNEAFLQAQSLGLILWKISEMNRECFAISLPTAHADLASVVDCLGLT